MYLEHFGLAEPPFRITPHTDFFFAGANRGPTLEALIHAVLHEEGIVEVSGEVGSGKTMLCRVLVDRLAGRADTLCITNPSLDPEALLEFVAAELGLAVASDRPGPLLRAIQDELLARFAAGRRVVALLDEAHGMPPAALEQVRLLSNLESGRHKLLQIVLFGQPELDLVLAQHHMRQLRDRITHRFRLAPLARDEVVAYLRFRLRAAGYRGPDLFDRATAERIWRISGGLTRRINILADKCLLAAFAEDAHDIAVRHVGMAARDAGYPMPTRWARWAAAAALTAALAAAGFALTRAPAATAPALINHGKAVP